MKFNCPSSPKGLLVLQGTLSATSAFIKPQSRYTQSLLPCMLAYSQNLLITTH
ncbi:hypothetical protein Syun_011415 [Stephania yunnanensis]|uniref:Uncharacterized protein n=1 Tax=Stephania yunnanensis TaxID=152371 RepID=A0AAP0PI46_9MAGN